MPLEILFIPSSVRAVPGYNVNLMEHFQEYTDYEGIRDQILKEQQVVSIDEPPRSANSPIYIDKIYVTEELNQVGRLSKTTVRYTVVGIKERWHLGTPRWHPLGTPRCRHYDQ